MKVFSLFSGIGGFDLGFSRAGMTVVAICEKDPAARSVARRHFPEATMFEDVREVHIERGAIDLLCGGFPCQDLSTAGKRQGLAGDRSGLWFEFARIIDEAEPAWVVIENVPGLFSSNDGRDFAVIVRWLADRGYGVGWRVLDAQGFGLAQRRKRVFIVGSFGNQRGCTVLLDAESVSGDFGSRRSAGNDGAGAATDVVAIQGNIVDRQHGGANGKGYAVGAPMYTLTAADRHAVAYHEFPVFALNLSYDGGIAENAPMYTVSSAIARQAVAFSGQHPGWRPDVEISPTVTTIRKNNVAKDGVVRRLTPTECERLQGFPDGWTAGQSDAKRHRQLGNAVAVPVAEWIGRRIAEAIGDKTV